MFRVFFWVFLGFLIVCFLCCVLAESEIFYRESVVLEKNDTITAGTSQKKVKSDATRFSHSIDTEGFGDSWRRKIQPDYTDLR